MSKQQRQERLLEDLKHLEALRDASTIFDFVSHGDPPDRYTLTFRGRGIRRDRTADDGVQFVDEHRCEIRLSYAYPERPPDLRWITPTYHPNVTFSGFISLRDLGLPWERDLSLDVVCERLWDVARMAYVDLDNASNFNAKNWLLHECRVSLPADNRPLRDAPGPGTGNIVRYERRGQRVALPQPTAAEEVFFIGDETTPGPAAPLSSRRRPDDNSDDGIFFIGDE